MPEVNIDELIAERDALRDECKMLRWMLKEVASFVQVYYPLHWWQGREANKLAVRLRQGIESVLRGF